MGGPEERRCSKGWQSWAELSTVDFADPLTVSECVTAQGSWGSLILYVIKSRDWSLGGVVLLGVAQARRLRAGRRCYVETHFFSSCSAR